MPKNVATSSFLLILTAALLPVSAAAVQSAPSSQDDIRKATQAAGQSYAAHDYSTAAAHYDEALKLYDPMKHGIAAARAGGGPWHADLAGVAGG